jgi:WD40 repeat protein
MLGTHVLPQTAPFWIQGLKVCRKDMGIQMKHSTTAILVLFASVVFGEDSRAEKPKVVASYKNEAPSGPMMFTPDSKYAVISNWDSLCLWDVHSRAVIKRIKDENVKLVHSLAFLGDGKTFVTATEAGVRVWELDTGKALDLDYGAGGPGWATKHVAVASDGELIAIDEETTIDKGMVTSYEHDVIVFNLKTKKRTDHLKGKGRIDSMAFSRDGRNLALAQAREGNLVVRPEVAIWDLQTLRRRHTFGDFKNYDGLVLAFSPDSKLLAIGGCGEIRLCDSATGRIQRQRRVDFGMVNAIDFSPDGAVLIAAGGKGTMPRLIVNPGIVAFWNVHSLQEIMRLRACDRDEASGIALSPDGKLLAVQCNRSATMSIWDVSSITGRTTKK